MNYNDLPEWYLPYFDNFTGPYWSDGRLQGSTSKARKKPITKLDWHSRDHDREYALCDSLECLDDADLDYYKRTRDMSLGPKVVGSLPLIGNAPLRKIYKLLGFGYKGSEVQNRKKMGAKQSVSDDTWKNEHPLKPGYEYHYSDGGQLLGQKPITVSSTQVYNPQFKPAVGQELFNDIGGSTPQPTQTSTEVVTAKPTEPKVSSEAVGTSPTMVENTNPPPGSTTVYEPTVDKPPRGFIDIEGGGNAYVSGFQHPQRGWVNQFTRKKKKKNKIYIAY